MEHRTRSRLIGPPLALAIGILLGAASLITGQTQTIFERWKFLATSTASDAVKSMGGITAISQLTASSLSISGVSTIGGTATFNGALTCSGCVTASDMAATAVTPGTYGSASTIPAITVDQQGRITNATTAAVTPWVLLQATSGTTTNAAAENVATQAISGLTAKDTLVVILTGLSSTQQTATLQLYNSTDSVNITTGATVAGNEYFGGLCLVTQSQNSATTWYGTRLWSGNSTALPILPLQVGSTQAWTGSWTLALRHAGVTAGGTLLWRWSVYKVNGQ